MDLALNGKSTVVTGAGSGIGKAVALAFAAEGANLVIADRDRSTGEQTTAQIVDDGGSAVFVPTDITGPAATDAMVAAAEESYGRLDIAVNNAGVAQPATPLHEITDELYSRIMNINLAGTFYSMRSEIPALLRAGGGAIVNVASIAAFTGTPGLSIYTATKHAVVGLTRSAATEYAKQGIRINAVAPGTIETQMIDDFIAASGDASVMDPIRAAHPIGRTGVVEDVTGAVLYLASRQASFTIGHTILVDGGFTVQ
jgi:NAD(P)-dependent dehydrogenase (short-subunit alcohol dehydrogenase family)